MSQSNELKAMKLMMKGMVSELSEEGKQVFEEESKIFNNLIDDVKSKIKNEDDKATATLIAGMIFLSEFGELVESAGKE